MQVERWGWYNKGHPNPGVSMVANNNNTYWHAHVSYTFYPDPENPVGPATVAGYSNPVPPVTREFDVKASCRDGIVLRHIIGRGYPGATITNVRKED
tara:strand:- start:355 stop:645 length:291 start_codon:yes stop_codon:yes gene_type:complete